MNTKSYTIRLIGMDDVRQYFEMIQENRSRLLNGFPVMCNSCQDLNSTRDFIQSRISRAKRKEFYTLLLLSERGEIAGAFSLKDIDWNLMRCEISYFIEKDFTDRGLASFCLDQVCRYLFSEMKLNKVFLRIAEENEASRHVAANNNFIIEGILRDDVKFSDGAFRNSVYYGLLCTDHRPIQRNITDDLSLNIML